MDVQEFVALVPNFGRLSEPDKIVHLGWYLHIERKVERFDVPAMRQCFRDLHMQEPPNLARDMSRLAERGTLLKDSSGYRLQLSARQTLDKKYGGQPTTVLLSSMLQGLAGKIPDQAEQLFLSEALRCYRAQAFRGAIVMTWNLAYDHLLRWVLADPARLAAFNSKIIQRIGAKRGTGLVMAAREDFEDLKESEVVDICALASLFVSGNTKKVLDTQLTKRNLAAHPSLLVIGQPNADDAIYDLVNNVVLTLI